jgi:hypothetical protein
MLDYFANFPKLIKHYVRSAIPNPKTLFSTRRVPSGAFLITREKTSLLLKANHTPTYYNTRLEQIEGAPNVYTTQHEPEHSQAPISSSFATTIQKRLLLNHNNPVTFVLDDPKTIIYHSTTTSETSTAQELEERLKTNPTRIISGWNDYASNNTYIWEILSPTLSPLKGETPLPESVLICGFPEENANHLAQWCDTHNLQLTNIISLTTAILFWAKNNGPTSGFLLLIITSTDHATFYIKGCTILGARIVPAKDTFHNEHIAQIDDLIEENNIDKTIPVWTYNFPSSGPEYAKITSKYPNTRPLTPQTFTNIQALNLPNEIVPDSDLWILDHILG